MKKSIPNDDDKDPDDLFGGGAPPPSEEDPAPDPFDPESLRLKQDFKVGVKKRQMVYDCRRPGRQEFVRVRAGAEWRLETAVFEDKATREIYLVNPGLLVEYAEFIPVCLFTAITRQADLFLWQAKLPGADGRSNKWNESALAAAQLAESKWIRISANMANGAYDVWEATGNLADPEWPDLSLHQILRLCFKDRYIQAEDHPVLKALRGES